MSFFNVMFAYNKVNMGTGNLLNPSWSGGDGMGGGGFGEGGSSGTSYYYGTGIGQPVPGESYGNFQYLSTSLEYSVGSYGKREGEVAAELSLFSLILLTQPPLSSERLNRSH